MEIPKNIIEISEFALRYVLNILGYQNIKKLFKYTSFTYKTFLFIIYLNFKRKFY